MFGDISSEQWTVCLVLSSLSLIGCLYHLMTSRRHRKYPPTPGVALPVVGHFYLLKKNPLPQYRKWRKTLGDVFMLKAGRCNVIVLNGHQTLKEALVKQANIFSERPVAIALKELPDICNGVARNNGASWKEQRELTISILRQFGMGKNTLARDISTEVDLFLKEIVKRKGDPFNPEYAVNLSVFNVIYALMFGTRFELNDKDLLKMIKTQLQFVSVLFKFTSMTIFFEWLLYLPFDILGKKNFVRVSLELINFNHEIVKKCSKEADPDTIKCFVDAYEKAMESKRAAGIETSLSTDSLNTVVFDLFGTGTETTSTTIHWFFVFMLYNPEIQEKIYQEILNCVGLDRAPEMSDKANLTYSQACILETQRLGNIIPLGIPHSNSEDAVINGYFIPKGSIVLPILDSLLMNEDVWGDPDRFRPERHLNDEGNILKKEEFLPFSLGKRLCFGEQLASMELFLFITAAVQKFKFFPEDENQLPNSEEIFRFGGVRRPTPFKLRCVERNP